MINKPLALEFEKELLKRKSSTKAKILSHYFKTGPGEYGEGDIFLGLSVVDQRQIVKNYLGLSLSELQYFLNSKFHEFRFSALLILIKKYQQADLASQEKIVNFYLKNIKNINNWDLVDVSCHQILGHYLFTRDRKMLYDLAADKNMWARRIAVVSNFYFIKNKDVADIYKLASILFNDKHDLMHKAVGWMLREAGKKDVEKLKNFLVKNKNKIPRTTLRYAIERFSESVRKDFLKK